MEASLLWAELEQKACTHAGDENVDHDRGEAGGCGEGERREGWVREPDVVVAGGAPPPEAEQNPKREPGDRSETPVKFLEFPGEPGDTTRAGGVSEPRA